MFKKFLVDECERYLLANQVCEKHKANLTRRITRFARFLGDAACVDDLTSDCLNRFLVGLEGTGLSPHTINGYRASVLAVWAFSLDAKPRGKIRRVRSPSVKVEGWTIAEVQQIAKMAATYRGRLPNEVKRSVFWLTAIHAGWCSGLRFGDLAALDVSAIRENQTASITQRKTGKLIVVKFSDRAMSLILSHGQSRVLPIPHTQKWFCEHFSILIDRSGVQGGSFKWLRRTVGSYVDRETGRGPEMLGNTRRIFDANYRVDAIMDRPPPEAPAI